MFDVRPLRIFLIGLINWHMCGSGHNSSSFSFDLFDTLPTAPVAEEIPREFRIHGQTFVDEYAWLRDPNWPANNVTDGKILDYIKAENEYAAKFYKCFQCKIDELTGVYGNLAGDRVRPYETRGDWLYYVKYADGKQRKIHCRKYKNADAREEVILDENVLAEGWKFTDIQFVTVSPDHDYLSYAVDHAGNEKFVIKIIRLRDNSYLEEEVRNVFQFHIWHGKIPGFFYVPVNERFRNDEVFFHFLRGYSSGSDGRERDEKFVFGVADKILQVMITASSSHHYVFFNVFDFNSNEMYALDVTTSREDFPVFLIRGKAPGIFYDVTHAGHKFYIRTNAGAKNYKVAAVSPNRLNNSNWEDGDVYVPEGKHYLKKAEATEKYLVMTYVEKGCMPVIKLKRFEDGAVKSVAFPDASYYAAFDITNYSLDDVRIHYSALHRPVITYKYAFDGGKLTVLKDNSSYEDDYTLETIRVPSGKSGGGPDDIVLIPATVFYKNSLFKGNGSNPAFVEAYGAYGDGASSSYRARAMTLADEGFVYVIAHVRGGDEFGTPWHESAKCLNKKRTFQDFVTVVEGLISKKYTGAGNIVAWGRSAGGTLVAAVANSRPELFKAAVAHVPFVDVLNTLLDETVPLTRSHWTELGNPLSDVEYFSYIKSYSPYENVKRQKYPNILVTAGLSDKRVGYYMVAKWVARLRKLKTDSNTVLLMTDMDSGHFTSSWNAYWKLFSHEITFIFHVFGII